MTLTLVILFGCLLAYANGANDNFKGVATLYGSATTGYRVALAWATATTFLGSLTALILAEQLLKVFSGKGLVPDAVVAMPSFSLAVVFAAAATVLLATRIGIPISTTHALTGALVGAGWLASPEGVDGSKLGAAFFAPLLLSPLLGLLACLLLYPAFRTARRRLGVEKETCVCIGTEVVEILPSGIAGVQVPALLDTRTLPTVSIGTGATCRERYSGTFWGMGAGALFDALHFLSAGLVGFSRGLNDTPKIAAMLLAGNSVAPLAGLSAVALFMALGGVLNSKKVAETLSHGITAMNAGQGFTANLVTAAIVISASKLGLPVSTTHVSCGALFGIGFLTRRAHWTMIGGIVLAWVTTLPLAAAIGALGFEALNAILPR
jgi:PiT family inorganic phosphate transporter